MTNEEIERVLGHHARALDTILATLASLRRSVIILTLVTNNLTEAPPPQEEVH